MEPKRDKKPETERKRTVVQGIQHLSSSFVSPSDTDVQTLHVTKGLRTTSTVPDDVDRILTAAEVSTEADKTTTGLKPTSEAVPTNPPEIGSENTHVSRLSSVETPEVSCFEQNERSGSNEAAVTLQTIERVVLPEPHVVDGVAAQPKKISYFIQRIIIDPNKKPESISTRQDFFNLLNIPRDNSQHEVELPGTDYFSIGTITYQNDFPLQFGEKQQNSQEGGCNYISLVLTGLQAETEIPLPAEENANINCNELKEQYEKRQSNLKLLEQYWQTVRGTPSDFTSWTYLLQHCENMGEINLIRSAYNEFLPLFPYCYGYWKRYCDVERKLGNDDRAVAILERGLQAIPLSVELWLALILYCKELGRADEKGSQEDYLRSLFERALAAAGLHFRSDNLWEAYIEWETVNRRLPNVVAIFKRLVGVPTRVHNRHWENLLVLVRDTDPKEFLDAKEYQLLRERVCKALKVNPNEPQDIERSMSKRALKRAEQIPTPKSSKPEDKVTTGMKERFIATLLPFREYCQAEVDKRFDFEDKIKRAYYHVKPLEKGQIEAWHAYLDFEICQGVHQRIVLLFERCLIACAHYEEFWARYARFMEQHRTRMRAKNQSQVPVVVSVSEPPQTVQVEPSNQVGVVPSERSPSFDSSTEKASGDKEDGTTPTGVEKEEPGKVVFAGVTKAAPVLYSTNQAAGTNPSQAAAGSAANNGAVVKPAVQFFYNETETVRAIYKRACLIHCCLKAQIKLQWALFEEEEGQLQLARELVYQVIYQHPGLLEARMQHVEMERRAGFVDHARELFEQFMTAADNLDASTYSWLAVQYARFLFKTLGQPDKALQILRKALKRDKSNMSLYLHVMDICYQRHPVDIKGITAALELGLLSKALDSEQKYELARRKTQVLREFGSIRAYRDSVDKLYELEKQKPTCTATPNDTGKKTHDQTPTYVVCVKCNQHLNTSVAVPAINTAAVSHAQLYNANYTDYYQASYQGIDAYNAAQYPPQHLSAAYPPPEGIPFPVLTEKAKDPNADQYKAVAPSDAINSPSSSQATKKDPMFQQWEDTQNKEYAKLETQRWETQPNHNVICSGYDEPELKRRRLLGKSCPRKKNFPYLGRFINMNALVDFRKGKFGEEVVERQAAGAPNDKTEVLKDNNEKEVAAVSEVVKKTVSQIENHKMVDSTVATSTPASSKSPVNEFADDSVIDQSEFVMETVLPSRESEPRNDGPVLVANDVREPEPEQFRQYMPRKSIEPLIAPSMQQNPARVRGQLRHFPSHEEQPRFRFREPSLQRFPTPFRPQGEPRFDPHGVNARFRPRREPDFRPQLHNNPRFWRQPPSFCEEERYFNPAEPPMRHPMSREQEYFRRDPHMHHPRYRKEGRVFPQDRPWHNPGNFDEFQVRPNQYMNEGRRPPFSAEPWPEEGMWGGPEDYCWVPPQRHREMGGMPSPVPGMHDVDVNFPEELQGPIPPPSRLRVLLPPRPPPPPPPGEKPCINVPAWFVEEGGELSLGQGQHGESILRYFPNFLNEQGQKMVFDGIRKQIKWHQRSSMDGDKWKLQQRLMAWIGPCNYDVAGTVFAQNTQWPSVCLELLHRLIEMTQLGLNSTFLDLYRSGHDYQGWHADNHPALGKSPTVVIVNTGSARVIEFRTRQREEYHFLRFPLLPGSLLVMNGPTQSDWLRGIPKDASVKQECMQLLFRVIYAALPQEEEK